MDYEWVMKNLPTVPSKKLIEWARNHVSDELGCDYLIHSAERIKVSPSFADMLEYDGVPPAKSVWASRCFCSCCQEEFITHKIPGVDAVRMYTGEDGVIYPAEPGTVYCGYEGYMMDVFDTEVLTCPNCFSDVVLLHRRNLRGGRKKTDYGSHGRKHWRIHSDYNLAYVKRNIRIRL